MGRENLALRAQKTELIKTSAYPKEDYEELLSLLNIEKMQ
jgi:hypothetical protein